MKLGQYKFAKSPFIFTAYVYDDNVVLKLPFSFFNVKLTQAQFNGALCLGHLDRHA